MTTLEATAELERLMGPDRMARPLKPLGEGSDAANRDPRSSWDAWYSLPMAARRRLLPYMAPAGHGLQPDDAAMVMGVDTPDAALERWAAACELARAGAWSPKADAPEWEWQAAQDALADIVGPHEVAAELGVAIGTVHQWRKRGLMPEPTRVISGVPLWTRAEIMGWALETGRATVDYLETF